MYFSILVINRGIMPFGQRKKIIEKARSKGKKGTKSGGASSLPEITSGMQVCSTINIINMF